MKCPRCKSEQAYIGLLKVECINEHCPNFSKDHAVSVITASEPALGGDIGKQIAESMWLWRNIHENSNETD